MMEGIQYETPVDLRQLPMVSAGADEIVLTMRPTSLWIILLEICGNGLFLCLNVAYLAFIFWDATWDNQSVAAGDLSEIRSWAVVGICCVIFQIYLVVGLVRRYRRGPMSRQLIISTDSVRLIYPGLWRIRTRSRPLSGVREVRIRNLKNIIGRPAGAILSVRFPRGPLWQFRFSQKQAAVAIEAHRLIREHVEGPNHSHPARVFERKDAR